MDMDFLTLVLILSSIAPFVFLRLYKKSAKLPPGPFPIPIIGNILQLGRNPHRSLAKLSKTYGPLMYLRLGSKEVIVVSSPETAKDILLKHDQVCCSRAVPGVVRLLNHHEASVAWLPTGSRWRKFRKICKEHLFTMHKLEAGEGFREEKLQQLRDYLEECSRSGRVVDIGEVVFTTSLNLMLTTLFSLDFDSEAAREMKGVIVGLSNIAGTPNLADYFPVLELIDPQGLKRKAEAYSGKLLAVVEEIISERLRSRGTSWKKNDLLEVLLDLNEESDAGLSRHEIMHLLFDLIVGAADTTTDTMVWAMTELLRNPGKISKVKDELKTVKGQNEQVQECDIPKLPYLNAVIKETFRCHPTAPFLLPRKTEANVEINGYLVPKNTQILINTWAIGRDERIWSNPDCFEPERFLGSKVDYRGKDFGLIPFGSGRRMCPGLPLAHLMVHLMVASMVHNFDWKLEAGIKPEEMDMNEVFGLTLHRAVPLKAFPIKGWMNP